MNDDLLNLPESLRNITGIGKERLIELKARVVLGLSLRDDEPITEIYGGKVLPARDVIQIIHQYARRFMRPSDGTPLEDSKEWRNR